jgi:ferrochelatase
MARRGVLLLQFGGPDSPEAIRPFLRDLFDDPEILSMPAFVRKPLAWTIAKFRAPKVAKDYAKMGVPGGASPLGMWTRKQAELLSSRLGLPVEVAMRAWKPTTAEGLAKLRAAGVDDVLALPLYPQYSFTTTRSSMTVLLREFPRAMPGATLRAVRHWPTEPAYVEATVETIRKGRAKLPGADPYVLFSAHGLPERIVAKGDPYPGEVEETVRAVASAAGLAKWSLSFQSRVGPVEWIRPFTEEKIPELAREGVKDLLVVPMSFTCDHFETLFEMAILQAEIAKTAGIERYAVAPALNDEPRFIEALEALARHGFESEPVRT